MGSYSYIVLDLIEGKEHELLDKEVGIAPDQLHFVLGHFPTQHDVLVLVDSVLRYLQVLLVIRTLVAYRQVLRGGCGLQLLVGY